LLFLPNIPERINIESLFNLDFSSPFIATKTSAIIFATTISYFLLVLFTEPTQISLYFWLFSKKLSFVLSIAKGSVSHKSTMAPFEEAASAKIPLPHPTSKRVSPSFTYLEIPLRVLKVVAWCPEPKAKAGSIIIFILSSFEEYQDGWI